LARASNGASRGGESARDHLRWQQLDHLGDVRLDALAIGTTLRTGALRGRHIDRIVDPPQVRRRG
jgi:hypothetical protein